jgi:hypothetical protein
MASSSETGHAINIANLKRLIDVCTAYGVKYNPSNLDLTIANLTLKWTTVGTAHSTMNTALNAAKVPINEREDLFDPLDVLTTQTLNYYKSTKALKQSKDDAKGYADKIRGVGVKVVKLPDGTPDPAHVSTSHQSFVQRQEAFQSLVDLYISDPLYAPNETELTTATLTTYSGDMKTANDDIGTIIEPVDALRITRDHGLYDEGTGVVDLALLAKAYSKGLWKANTPEAKQITGIKFTRPKKD